MKLVVVVVVVMMRARVLWWWWLWCVGVSIILRQILELFEIKGGVI
jgi:hypothetical protein